MAQKKYIVVEGPIGVGKTSLAKLLAAEFQARTVFETVEDNPFLSKFYQDGETYAFQNQFFFHYDESPLLVVNTSEIDFVASSQHLADLVREINRMGPGTQHYIPLGSR